MNVTRFGAALAYYPPGHDGMRCLRLQGHEAGASSDLWLGVSVILPGGSTTQDAALVEKHYVVLEGAVTISASGERVVLGQYDSIRLAPGEARKVEHTGNRPALLLLAMPHV